MIWTACPQLARPYRGLRDFSERDRPFFFGRKAFVGRLREKLQSHPIVGVAGASGSGKSSVVKAGLIPALRNELDWTILKIRPAADPWAELARELVPLLHRGLSLGNRLGEEEKLAEKLRADPSYLGDCLTGIAQANRSERVLVFVDQFEELFTQAGHDVGEMTRPTGRRDDFRDLMIQTALLKGSPSIQWIYTLRADFAGQAYRHPAFVEALKDGEEKLPDMNATELRQSIIEPARKLEVDFESGKEGGPSVSERIADAVEARPGSLPLMAHLLEKLWEKLERRQITHAAYDGLGGLEGALDRHADEVYEELPVEQKARARRLLSRLVKIEEGNEPIRRIRTRAELGEELWEVAGLLADADRRLLVIRGEAAQEVTEAFDTAAHTDRQTVEVAHEALLRNWGKFRTWLNEDLAFLLWQQKFELRMEEYQESGLHLSGTPLQTALDWLTTRNDDLNKVEQDFITNSRLANEKRRKEDARKQQLLIVALTGIVAVLSAALLSVIAVNEHNKRDGILASAAALVMGGHPLEAAVLGVAAMPQYSLLPLAPTSSAAKILLDSGMTTELVADLGEGYDDSENYESASQIFVHRLDQTATLLSMENGDVILDLAQPGSVYGHSLSRDGRWLITRIGENATLWDATNGTQLWRHDNVAEFTILAEGGKATIRLTNGRLILLDLEQHRILSEFGERRDTARITYAKDGSNFISASVDDQLHIWDGNTGRLIGGSDQIGSCVYCYISSDGMVVVGFDSKGSGTVFDGKTGKETVKLEYRFIPANWKLTPNGQRVVAWARNDRLAIWDTRSGAVLVDDQTYQFTTAAVTEDGKYVICQNNAHGAQIWRTSDGAVAMRVSDGFAENYEFSGENNSIVTRSINYTARVYHLISGQSLQLGSSGEARWVAVSGKGRFAVTGGPKVRTALWDGLTGRRIATFDEASPLSDISFSKDEMIVIESTFEDNTKVWSTTSGKLLTNLGGVGSVQVLYMSSNDRRFISNSNSDHALLWARPNLPTELKTPQQIREHVCRVNRSQIGLAAAKLRLAGRDELLGLPWNPCDWKGLMSLEGWTQSFRSLLISVGLFRDYACGETELMPAPSDRNPVGCPLSKAVTIQD